MVKKYTLEEIDCFNHGIHVIDRIKDKDNGIELPQSTVCELLNQLSEENEELKKLIINKNEIQLKTLEELQKTQKELITIKNTIKDMYDNERTHLGHNVLAQLMEAIQ